MIQLSDHWGPWEGARAHGFTGESWKPIGASPGWTRGFSHLGEADSATWPVATTR